MKRSPEQLAKRNRRRALESTYLKCRCGNVAGLHQVKCRRCRDLEEDEK